MNVEEKRRLTIEMLKDTEDSSLLNLIFELLEAQKTQPRFQFTPGEVDEIEALSSAIRAGEVSTQPWRSVRDRIRGNR
ncbi:MAG: hypothetical protein AAF570_28725 [Bacteroidota bacterium]